MDGYLLIDKPVGISSFGALARVRRVLSEAAGKKVKIGHCGTLDPAASGLIILVIGKYTKKAQEFSRMDKAYEAQITLGQNSTTADREGDLSKVSDRQPDLAEVQEVLNTFIGQIKQTPPAFSAIKVDGKRAYKLAREGKEVKIEPRNVNIYSISDVSYRYPTLSFTVSVSSGTYIRSLAEDIGKKLGTGAYLSDLRRISIDKYKLADAIRIENLDFPILEQAMQQGL